MGSVSTFQESGGPESGSQQQLPQACQTRALAPNWPRADAYGECKRARSAVQPAGESRMNPH